MTMMMMMKMKMKIPSTPQGHPRTNRGAVIYCILTSGQPHTVSSGRILMKSCSLSWPNARNRIGTTILFSYCIAFWFQREIQFVFQRKKRADIPRGLLVLIEFLTGGKTDQIFILVENLIWADFDTLSLTSLVFSSSLRMYTIFNMYSLSVEIHIKARMCKHSVTYCACILSLTCIICQQNTHQSVVV